MVLAKVMNYIILLATIVTLGYLLIGALNLEKYNQVRADDLSLTFNSVFIPKDDLSLDYDMGSTEREIIFEEGFVKTYIDDDLRGKKAPLVIDGNYVFEATNLKTNFLEVVKKEDKVVIT